MAGSKVLFDIADGVATLRLNDPGTLNSLSGEMIEAISAGLQTAARDARALVVAGGEKGFCSGANLGGGLGLNNINADFDAGEPLERSINPLMLALRDLDIPWISAVRGAAAGVGASLALAADLIVAGESSYFLQAFRRIGLVPDGGSSYLLTRAVGRPRAMEMMLLGEKLPATQAMEWGLINRLVADDKVEETALALARNLAAGPKRALSLIRRNAWTATDTDLETALQAERAAQREAGRHPDFREGLAAFLEKRPARFGA